MFPSGDKLKVLYICPLAHAVGHYPFVVGKEPQALKDIGLDITLLTFTQITDKATIQIPHRVVLYKDSQLLKLLRKNIIGQWFSLVIEIMLTLAKGLLIYHKEHFNAIFLRDGEPLYLLPIVMSLPFKNVKWVIRATGSSIYPPDVRKKSSLILKLYYLIIKSLSAPIFKPLYKLGLKHNHFTFSTENEVVKRGLESYQGGTLKGIVFCTPPGTDCFVEDIDKRIAREHFKLPSEKTVVLSFGAPHAGKDLTTIFEAVGKLEDIVLLHAGRRALSTSINPDALASRFNLNGRISIHAHYIPESEKPYFFLASDACVLSYTKAFANTASLLWDAAKFQTPVISSDANVLGETVRKYKLGLLFKAEDTESLKEAILKFKSLPAEEIQEFKRNCKAFTQEYTLSKWAERTKELLTA